MRLLKQQKQKKRQRKEEEKSRRCRLLLSRYLLQDFFLLSFASSSLLSGTIIAASLNIECSTRERDSLLLKIYSVVFSFINLFYYIKWLRLLNWKISLNESSQLVRQTSARGEEKKHNRERAKRRREPIESNNKQRMNRRKNTQETTRKFRQRDDGDFNESIFSCIHWLLFQRVICGRERKGSNDEHLINENIGEFQHWNFLITSLIGFSYDGWANECIASEQKIKCDWKLSTTSISHCFHAIKKSELCQRVAPAANNDNFDRVSSRKVFDVKIFLITDDGARSRKNKSWKFFSHMFLPPSSLFLIPSFLYHRQRRVVPSFHFHTNSQLTSFFSFSVAGVKVFFFLVLILVLESFKDSWVFKRISPRSNFLFSCLLQNNVFSFANRVVSEGARTFQLFKFSTRSLVLSLACTALHSLLFFTRAM